MDLASLKLPELKKECKARGLPVGGNKAELVGRLQAAMAAKGEGAKEMVKTPSEDSMLEDALIDEDSMLEDDSGAEDGADLNDLNDLTSPTLRDAPKTLSPTKKPEPVKRPASALTSSPTKVEANGTGQNVAGSPAKKKIVINREPVEAPAPEPEPTKPTETSAHTAISSEGVGGDGKVKIVTAALTSEERAKLRAQKFGVTSTETPKVTAPAASASNGTSAAAVPAPAVVDEKLKKRAERFNTAASVVPALERKISLTTEDDVKLAKRKERFGIEKEEDKKDTRAARFGNAPASSTNASTSAPSDKKQLRAARFGST